MKCEEVYDSLADRLRGELEPTRAAALEVHLAACPACREEAAAHQALWDEMGRLPDEAPGGGLRPRFYRMLAAAEAAQGAGAPAGPTAAPWWSGRGLQRAAAVALVVLGAAAGLRLVSGAREIGELRREVRSLSQLVTLSLLEQESASERLKGVSFGRDVGQGDDQVLQALLEVIARDPNDNVRLAAIDALKPAAGRPRVRERLVAAVPGQQNPLVQIALIDSVLGADDGAARRELETLLATPGLHPTVHQHLVDRLGQRL